ncbi:MAG TPA: DNA recombination protein RmuC [Chthoniobacterales bacterium]|nr:DNA recombination protein RmuC [Chthoniobacterales bacterium]
MVSQQGVSPLLYLLLGLTGGGLLATLGFLLVRRGPQIDPILSGKIEAFREAQERDERSREEEAARLREETSRAAKAQREELSTAMRTLGETNLKSIAEIGAILKSQLETVATQTGKLTQSNEARLESLRSVVDLRLKQLQEDNAQQIEKMRATVDEKLQGTLEKRLGESFQMVSERLERVHQGLGAMQQLASDVGGLQRVLTNVKTRGGWGEVQLGALLEEVLAPEQFARNVRTREGSGENVEFAIRLPGNENGVPVWLPIDAKFPVEDHQRLIAAQESADPIATEQAMKNLETQLRKSAKDICAKYINPPQTTNFALMFLPTEGLFAEAIRRIGLVEQVRRESKVIFAGPTTLAALLNSLQMGFRTLAIQKSSSEVWSLLATVRTEFGKFGGLLDGVKKKLEQASNQIEDMARKSRTIEKRLNRVEELPSHPEPLLPDLLPNEETEGEE